MRGRPVIHTYTVCFAIILGLFLSVPSVQAEETAEREYTHAPVAEGACDVCHAPHGSEQPGVIVVEAPELCGSCHDSDETLFAVHGGYDISTADCLDCHDPHDSERPGLIRDILHPPYEEQSCEDCHDKGDDNKTVLVAGMGDLCGACHDVVSEGLEMSHLHGPFAGEDCGGCHRLHASDNSSLLRMEGASLCLTCHEDLKEKALLEFTHEPFENGRCPDCHKPHASANAGLLTESAETLCLSCHKDIQEEMASGAVHAPVADGDCGSCHEPHASPHEGLLNSSKFELCGQCHDTADRTLRTAHKGFDLEGVDCQNCHAAHVGPEESKSLLLPDEHAPFAEGECTSCHEGLEPHELIASGNELCFACHEDFLTDAADMTVHEPLRQQEGCGNCHGPHVGYGSLLVSEKGPGFCLSCHGGPEFTGANQHSVAFEDCGNCHQPHTSPNRSLLTEGDITALCVTCHDGAEVSHYHPMGARAIDPRTGEPLNCAGCHSPHSSDYPALVVADKGQELCVICHKASR